MRLYLSSYWVGNNPEVLTSMITGNKRAAIILNARDYFSIEDRESGRIEQTNELKKIGITAAELDLRNYFGRQNDLEKELEQFDAVWIPGGNSFLLRHAMRESGFDTIIKNLLQEDKIVYAGYSAGIVVLCETLKGIEIVDDIKYVKEIYNTEPVWDGLGILPYSIAPHYKSNHPESELIDELVEYFIKEKIPYKTLSDGDTIVIR
ncbi:MAG: Type 1 glutamine amidotransferase-like domain-containing protein [Ignavibacteria bacterium]|nr:Type 1 glutamine amidotransferase-like domain-containing protein [Ignavibacteria bacterium]